MKFENLTQGYVSLGEVGITLGPLVVSRNIKKVDLDDCPGLQSFIERGLIKVVNGRTPTTGDESTKRPEDKIAPLRPLNATRLYLCAGTKPSGGKCIAIVAKAGELCDQCKGDMLAPRKDLKK